MIELEPIDSFGSVTSIVIVALCGGIITLCFLFAVGQFFIYFIRTQNARTAMKPTQQVKRGSVLLSGRVETRKRNEPAIRIEINQTGKDYLFKGNWTHIWKEDTRTIKNQSFWLRLTDGSCIKVEPDKDTVLIGDLKTETHSDCRRQRVAELNNGTQVWISGMVIQDDFQKTTNSPVESLILSGTKKTPLKVTTNNFDAQFSYWQCFYLRAAAILGLAFLVVNVVLFGHFHAELWLGNVEEATYTHTTVYQRVGKVAAYDVYVIHARLPESYDYKEVSGEVSGKFILGHDWTSGRKVPFRIVPLLPDIYTIGHYADATIGYSVIAFFVTITTVFCFVSILHSAAPWYEQNKVFNRATGRLDEHIYK